MRQRLAALDETALSAILDERELEALRMGARQRVTDVDDPQIARLPAQLPPLFAAAARNAGRDLNRRSFVTALSRIKDFPGTNTPTLSYGPDKRYGPVEYQVVRLHVNAPVSSLCKLPKNKIPQLTCWVTVQPFEPLPPG